MELSETQRNAFHILRGVYSGQTHIFFFNLPRGQCMDSENYKLLKSIKDGSAIAGIYNSKKLILKKPNILIVFANNEPYRSKLSKDRWKILKITNNFKCSEHLEKRGVKQEKSKGERKIY